MSKVIKAADEVRKLTKMFQGLADVVEVLDRVGSVEQAEQEAKARIDKLNAEVLVANEGISAAHSEAKRVLDEAKVKADELIDEGKRELASALNAAADHQANAIDKCNAIALDAQARIDAASAKVADLETQHAAVAAEVVELEKRAEKARAYLAKLAG
jgi:chromosome segregation ATPase